MRSSSPTRPTSHWACWPWSSEAALSPGLLQGARRADRGALVLLEGVRVVVCRVLGGGRAIGEGAQYVRCHATDEVRGAAADAVRLVAVDRLDPAHRPGVEDARAARVRVVGGVTEAGRPVQRQRRV